jgi:Protein of unknown function (DUF2786)
MRWVKDDGGRAAAGFKESRSNDCVFRAVAIATERPYQEIYDRLEAMIVAKFGAKRPAGVENRMEQELMTSLGWVWVPAPGVSLRRDDLPPGRLVVRIKEHSVAVVNGTLHDTYDCSRWGTELVCGFFKQDVSIHSPMNAGRKKMLDAVTKILALADSTEHEAEAATAKAKAAELVAKYDIELGETKNLEGFKAEGVLRGGVAIPSYEIDLLDAVGKFCGVLVLQRDFDRDYVFFGRPHDLEAFHYMREVVSAQQDKGWKDYVSKYPFVHRQRVAWKYSFSQGVRDKVDDLMRAAEKHQKTMRQDLALVPRQKQAQDAYEDLFGKLKESDALRRRAA